MARKKRITENQWKRAIHAHRLIQEGRYAEARQVMGLQPKREHEEEFLRQFKDDDSRAPSNVIVFKPGAEGER